jgi:UDP-MurNAc hydroxylase
MKFEFIGNACGIFHGSKGTKILCDPWIVDGVFEGSWFHYPPLKTKLSDLQNVDAIYVSHIHPDHFDDRYFNFPKDKRIIILNEEPNFLKKKLLSMGYENLLEIKNNETKGLNEFNLTLFKPFASHIYEESFIGNLIDSAIVFQDNELTAINFNDNTPTVDSSNLLKDKFKKIDLAMINYNAAGPYPSCFDNLNVEQKKMENDRILKKNFDHVYDMIEILKAECVLPFAGSYILGGKNVNKNEYLGTTTWDECADFLKKKKSSAKIICMREGQKFDLVQKKLSSKYEKIDTSEMKKYYEKIKDTKYPYEKDDNVDLEKLEKDLALAKNNLQNRIKNFGVDIQSNVFILIKNKKHKIIDGKDKEKFLFCDMDLRLLRRILDRKSHWNNAELGCHINFIRKPNKMEPDVHRILSFLHL